MTPTCATAEATTIEASLPMKRSKSVPAQRFSVRSPQQAEFMTSTVAKSFFELAQSMKDQGLYKPRHVARKESRLSLLKNRDSVEADSIWSSCED